MGLGKTLQTTALILANPPKGQQGYPYLAQRNKNNAHPRCTMIVCPVSVIANWQTQFRQFVDKDARLNIKVYHGPNRSQVLAQVANNKVDILLTSFQTLASDHKKFEDDQKEKEAEETTAQDATGDDDDDDNDMVVDMSIATPRKARKRNAQVSQDGSETDMNASFTSEEDDDDDDDDESMYDDDEEEEDCSLYGDADSNCIFNVAFHRIVVRCCVIC